MVLVQIRQKMALKILYPRVDSLILGIAVQRFLLAIIRLSMTHSNATVSPLVAENLSLLKALKAEHGVLDLACGNGRNGMHLVRNSIAVTFADRNAEALAEIDSALAGGSGLGKTWLVDLEAEHSEPLAGTQFDAILVFNYLHRPLMNAIGRAIKNGGLLFYETFTTAQREFGRPNNPDFLLRPGELQEYFSGWEILQYFEGERENPQRAVASLIAKKPGP